MAIDRSGLPRQEVCVRDSRLDSSADREAAQALFEHNGYPRTAADVAWVYAPVAGHFPHASLAVVPERVAALYAAVPARFVVNGESVMAAQSLDTMVDSRFRGLGLFTKLARVVNDRMSERGLAFVYGFPNGNSIHGFVSKLDWLALDPVPFLFRPINLGYAVSRLSKRLGSVLRLPVPILGKAGTSTPLEDLPDPVELDALWSGFRTLINVARVRDHQFLEHRYRNHPRARYRYRVVHENGCLAGLAISCIEDKHGGRIGYVMELMCLPGRSDLARGLLADTLRDMADAGCDGALAWCFRHSPYRRAFLRHGFVPLPERVRPIELHFGFRPLSTSSQDVLSQRANWYISYSDSDTV